MPKIERLFSAAWFGLGLMACAPGGQGVSPAPLEESANAWGDAGVYTPPPPDETPPVITLLSPIQSCLSGVVEVRFTAVDEERSVGYVSARFAGVLREVTTNGDGSYSFSLDVTPMFEGAHELVIKAIDIANNEAVFTAFFGVSHGGGVQHEEVLLCDGPIDDPNPPGPVFGEDAGPDVTPPELSILQPAADSLIGSNPYIQVRALDASMPVRLVLTVGDVTVSETVNTAFHVFEPDLQSLSEGPATLTVQATDDVDNTTSVSQTVNVDLTAPQIRIIEPTAGAQRLALTDVKVCASDANGIASILLYEVGVDAVITSSSNPLVRSDGSTGPCNANEEEFGLIHELEDTSPLPRNTTFELVAVDQAGNRGQAQVSITLLPIN